MRLNEVKLNFECCSDQARLHEFLERVQHSSYLRGNTEVELSLNEDQINDINDVASEASCIEDSLMFCFR